MSEYKLTVYSSNIQHRIKVAFYALCLLSVWLWPDVNQWQWLVQLPLSLLLIYWLAQLRYIKTIDHQLVLSEVGEVYVYLSPGESKKFKLSKTSVTSDWFCLLKLQPDNLPGIEGKTEKIWVFRDGIDEQSYRRICRVIHRIRRTE